MRAVVKRPGEPATITDIGGDSLQELVGGWIEAVELDELGSDHITSYANEEGLMLRLAPNVTLPGYELIVGPLVALGLNRRTGESEGLTEQEAEQTASYLNSHAVTLRDLVRLGIVRVHPDLELTDLINRAAAEGERLGAWDENA